MSEHTPGEWKLIPGDPGDDSVGLGPTPATVVVETENNDSIIICTLHEPWYRTGGPPADEYDECVGLSGTLEGNGDLIVAAPDLRRALAVMTDFLEVICGNIDPLANEAIDLARKALAKAKGVPR